MEAFFCWSLYLTVLFVSLVISLTLCIHDRPVNLLDMCLANNRLKLYFRVPPRPRQSKLMCLKLILRKHQNQLQLPRLLNRLKRRYMILKLTGVEALCPVYFLSVEYYWIWCAEYFLWCSDWTDHSTSPLGDICHWCQTFEKMFLGLRIHTFYILSGIIMRPWGLAWRTLFNLQSPVLE